jgi:hypothetical protein
MRSYSVTALRSHKILELLTPVRYEKFQQFRKDEVNS